MVSPSPCEDNDFFDRCADGISTNWIRLWADKHFSIDLQWTIHSLSGEGAPFEFTVNETTFGKDDIGTKFGEGQSLGFKLSKNLFPTFGLTLGADRLYHLDKTTDLPKKYLYNGHKSGSSQRFIRITNLKLVGRPHDERLQSKDPNGFRPISKND